MKKTIKIIGVIIVVFVVLKLVFGAMNSINGFLNSLPWYGTILSSILFIGFIFLIYRYFEKR